MKTKYEAELLDVMLKLQTWGKLPDAQVDMQAVRKLQKRMSVLGALASGATPAQAEMLAQMSMTLMAFTSLDALPALPALPVKVTGRPQNLHVQIANAPHGVRTSSNTLQWHEHAWRHTPL